MPRFVGIAGQGFFSLGVAQNEAEVRKVFMDFRERFGIGEHGIVVADNLAISDEKDVDGESGMMFGAADGSEVFLAVFWPEFGVGRPTVPDVLLLGEGAIGAVEFDSTPSSSRTQARRVTKAARASCSTM